jgi:hypothetical protein
MFKRLIPVFLVFIIVSVCFMGSVQAQQEETDTLVVLLGDMTFDLVIGDMIASKGTQFPFEGQKFYIDDADLTLANLENPISERGTPEEDKFCVLCSKKDTVNCLVYAGIDAVSLSNNHLLDYGHDALNDTLVYLDRANIKYTGIWYTDPIENCTFTRPAIMERNGLKFGFLAYMENISYQPHWKATPTRIGPMPMKRWLMQRDIEYAKDLVDVLVVSLHWRKKEQYSEGPNGEDEQLCRDVIDWGADVIMGTGPHTVHKIEDYNDGLILYSIGNAAMACRGNNAEKSFKSYIVRLLFRGDAVHSVTLVPTQLYNYRYIPYGMPLSRTAGTGMNITRAEIMGMYSSDIFNVSNPEDFEKNQWFIFRSGDPWYYKALSLLVLLVSLAVIGFIFYSIFKKKGKSLLNLEEEVYGPSDNGQQPDPDPGGQQQGAKDKGKP